MNNHGEFTIIYENKKNMTFFMVNKWFFY